MAVLEMLSKMVRSEELLAGITLAELVHLLQMAESVVPVVFCGLAVAAAATAARKLIPAIATSVSFAWPIATFVECLIIACNMQGRARPAMPPNMQAVLMTFCLILVLEAISTKGAFILLLCRMCANVGKRVSLTCAKGNKKTKN